MKADDYIKEVFIRMTSRTVPYGHEDDFVRDIMPLIFPEGIQKDDWGNYFYKIGESRTIFASHLDTVSKEYQSVTHVFDGKYIKTDGKTTLGADDKAGVTVLLWMIQNNIPGLYYFFIGEEVGCIGSGLAAKYGDFKGKYDRIISFDRRDVESIITFQSYSRCCSDAFADDLCHELNKSGMVYSKDTGGVYTDSAEFVDIIPECTNVSVGYYKEHTTEEKQDIEHLINLCKACVEVDWENLSVKRNPSVHEAKSYSSSSSSWSGNTYSNRGRNWRSRDYGYHDDWYDEPKKTRRAGKKNNSGKVYYDSGSELLDITRDFNKKWKSEEDIDTSDKYAWIISKFVDDEFTWSDLQVIKSTYLNMESDYDKYFYDYLLEQLVDV
jgi:hypothetical protein